MNRLYTGCRGVRIERLGQAEIGRQFGPIRFEEFQLSADIHHEIHLTGPIAPEEQTAGASTPIRKFLKRGSRIPAGVCSRLSKAIL